MFVRVGLVFASSASVVDRVSATHCGGVMNFIGPYCSVHEHGSTAYMTEHEFGGLSPDAVTLVKTPALAQ